jgi:hypothetical protein
MTTQEKIDETIEKICDDTVKIYHDLEFSHHDFYDCLLKILECISMTPILVNSNKKELIIGMLVLITNKLNIKQEEREKIMYLINTNLIGSIIDLILEISKNKKCDVCKKLLNGNKEDEKDKKDVKDVK